VVNGSPVKFVATPEVGVPSKGVTSVGDVANTLAPVPVSSVSAVAKFADVKEPNDAALPTDVIIPVRLALVVTLPEVNPDAVPVILVPTKALGVPKAGVTSVGLVANTAEPVPVSSVNVAARLALVGVVKKVAIPEARPLTPELIGSPTALVSVPDDGVPKTPALTKGEPAEPTLTPKAVATPVPNAVIPVPPLATGKAVPEYVMARVPEDVIGLPAMLKILGTVAATLVTEPAPAAAHVPSPRQKVDAVAEVPELRLVTARLPITPVLKGRPVIFVATPEAGVPSKGVTNVGELANTLAPVPVSSVRAAARFAEEGVAKNVATPLPKPLTPVLIGKPVALVSVTLTGVPRIGVTSVGEVLLAFVATATARASNSTSNSEPLIRFAGVPGLRASFGVKLVVLV